MGSGYRRPGAKLVAPADALGAITAGCLDGPFAELAAEARDSGTATLETFDLIDDDWELGPGCNGVINVLVVPLDDSLGPILRALEAGNTAAALTVESDAGTETDGNRVAVPADALPDLQSAAETVREASTSTLVAVSRAAGDLGMFVDRIEPAPELLLFSAENDANAVADLGSLVEHPDRTYAVLLSHNLVDDRLALEALLDEIDVLYIGLMGPRKRFEDLCEAAASANDQGRSILGRARSDTDRCNRCR